MKKVNKLLVASTLCGAMLTPGLSSATNGMNMEGYGPIATGMGGASMAYDNGAAATMNNPATLGLMEDGTDELDIAVGTLSPDITTSLTGMPDADSSATMFIMPAMGWVRKSGNIAYGVGMFSQGGMGTEYDSDSFLAAGSGDEVRSEVGVGRLIAPISYSVSPDLVIGGSVDFVWAGMDLKMALSGSQFFDFTAFGSQAYGRADGTLVQGLGQALTGADGDLMTPGDAVIAGVNWARFDFSDSSAFTGEAMGTGFGGKLGGVYKIGNRVQIGASYHSKTSISDLTTEDANISMSVVEGPAGGGFVCGGAGNTCTIPFSGEIKVRNFQWPDIFALGTAFQATKDLMLVADYKRINWPSAMKDFKMIFTADGTQSNPVAQNFVNQGGRTVDVVMYQDWEVQNVFQLGGAYRVIEPLVLRAGLSIGNNPIPDEYVNALFPAIVQNHITLGAGYSIAKAHVVNFSLVHAPETKVEATHPLTGTKTGLEITHAQTNMQLMYSYMF